ncbi:MAG TPA: hypothetical protein PLS19_09140 [bacterium]|nr:hypothetical protein [bacterium]HPN94712.1 hypothetical protein [bacterium]
MNETMKWNITKGFLGGILMLLEEDDRRGLLDYDEMMIELKELGAYSLTHADVLYSAKGLRLLSLAAFFGMPFAGDEFDFSRNAWRRDRLSARSLEYRATGDISKWFSEGSGNNADYPAGR